MEAEAAGPLFEQILIKTKFDDNVDEVLFPSPVCLTGVTVGATPGAAPQASLAFISVFARDTATCAAARFACLYEGLKQPAAGTTSAQIQPFVTDHVVLRGRYQTVPLTLHGYSLDKAAEGHVPRPETPTITLEAAAPRFLELATALPAPAPAPATISYASNAQPALEALLKHWRKVGSSERKIQASPLPEPAWKAAMAAADAVAGKLAAGGTAFELSAGPDAGTATPEDHELIDMAMGWTGLLAEVPGSGGRGAAAAGAAGLAAAVLVCTRPSAVSAFLARHGQLLLADALAAPAAPGSQLRHAAAACLLLAQGAGALGCEALLGWWSPSFVQWAAKKGQQAQAEGGRDGRDGRAAAAEAVVPQVDGAGDDRDGGGGGRKKHGGKRGGKKRRGGGGGGPAGDVDPDDRWDGGGDDAVDRYYASDRGHRDDEADLRRQREREREREQERGRERDAGRERPKEPERPRGDLRAELNRRRQERERQEKEEKEREERREKKVEARGRQPGRDADRPPRAKDGDGADAKKEQPPRQKEPERRRSPAPRERAEPRGGGGGERQRREEREDAAQLHRFTLYWDERLKSYAGVYAPLGKALMEVRPAATAAVGARLLRLLRFYERAAAFSAAAEDLARQHLPAKRAPAPPAAAAAAAATAGAALAALADALAASAGGGDPVSDAFASAASAPEPVAVSAAPEPTPLLLELMAARRVLPLLPAVLAVPATLRARGLEDGDATVAAAASTAAMAMAGDLSVGVRALLAALASGAAGLAALAAPPGAGAQLLRLLQRPGALEPALAAALAPLGDVAVALAAVDDFLKASLTSPTWASATVTLGSFLDGPPSQRLPALLAASLRAGEVLPRCADAVEARCAVLAEASGVAPPPGASRGAPDVLGLLDALPALDAAFKLLEALAKAGHPGVASRVAPAAPATLSRLAAAAQRACGLPAAGASAAYAALEGAIGGLEAVVSAAKGGLWAVLAALDAALPPLATETLLEAQREAAAAAGGGEDPEEFLDDFAVYGGDNGDEMAAVDWDEVRGLWDDPRRRGQALGALRALAAALWAPRAAGRAAAAAAAAEDGQRLVLRAVAAAGAALAAAHADAAWVARAGAAIDPAAAAGSRAAALEFLEVAAAAAAALLQHLRDGGAVDGAALPAALLEAHAELCADEACLAALMGAAGAGGSAASAALAARRHLASALRCWIEVGAAWAPPLLPLVLFGPQHARRRHGDHAVPALPPRQIFAAACLLGDLSPEEWPPWGRRAANPPPSARLYRVAFANAIDNAVEPFRALVAACVEGESPLLRAAAVRAVARAAGFGGGMGAFVAGPLVAALEAGLASPTAVHDLRKPLELLVPLVYRPAFKAGLLDGPAAALLAEVLRVMATGVAVGAPPDAPPQAIDTADGAAVCTMALECLGVLCNPEQVLDPGAPPAAAALEDVPSAPRALHVASTLLEMLPSLGANVALGQRVLRLLTATPPGRAALRRAVAALHAASTGDPPPADPGKPEVVPAAQWVAQRYWGLSQQAQTAGAPGAEAFADVAEIMKEICLTMEDDGPEPPPPPPAKARFGAAAKAATGGLSALDETRWDRGDYLPAAAPPVGGAAAAAAAAAAAGDFGTDVFDAVTRTFWKNLRARAVPSTPAGAAAVLRKYTRHPVAPDEGLSVAATLHPPLTHPLRPLAEGMGEGDGEGEGELGEGEEARGEEEQRRREGADAVPLPSPVPAAVKEEGPAAGAAALTPAEIPVAVVGVAPEPILAPVVPAEAPPADFDLYEDLGADLGISVAPVVAAPAVSAPASSQPAATPTPAATPAAAEDPAALLADPAKMQELLADPVKMQELLVKHPSLVSALKSKLGGGSGGGGSGN